MDIQRPMLKPGLQRVWRGPDTLQLGLDVPRPVLLHPVDDAVELLLGMLDGRLTRAQLLAAAAPVGVDPADAIDVLAQLADAGLLADAAVPDPDLATLPRSVRERLAPDLAAAALQDPRPDAAVIALRSRRALRVQLRGHDRLDGLIADRLREAGVGQVEVGGSDTAVDPGPRTRGGHPGSPLVVLSAALARSRRRELLESSTSHLVTEVGETVVRLGPLVLPGRSACFGCLEHRRLDRDPGWGPVSAQLATGHAVAGSGTLLDTAASLVVLHLLGWAAGGTPPELDGVVEVGLPHGQAVRRDCPPHPACGCTWPSDAGDVTMAR